MESHFKNSFFKDSNKGRTDYLVHGLKINEENEEKRRGRTTIKVSESQIRESNGDDWPLKLQRSSLNSTDKAAEMDPNFVVRLHQHNISGVTNLKFF